MHKGTIWRCCPHRGCASGGTGWWPGCRRQRRSSRARWSSSAAAAGRRGAGAHEASCTGRMRTCRWRAAWSTCRPCWRTLSALTWRYPGGCRRRWRRSRRSTWSCWPAGSWTSPWLRPARSRRRGTWPRPCWPSWSPRWPTWPRPRCEQGRGPAMIRGEQKVTRAHLERMATVYVRQSTLMQVREHAESTARQYGLAGLAARLGWAAADIEVIDADLGLSGRSATYREGFKQLVARVCLGEVGAVFGLEVSRLARSNADLARLLELARLTGTLVIDSDGVYDLREFNDRLLLGLKGAMSEAELHILAGRVHGANRAAAERGELRFALPVGYVRDAEGATIIDPDQEVTAAVADVFAAFQTTGSAYGAVGAFTSRRFPRRAYGGVWAGELRWGRLTHSRVVGILSNPAYAGAYVFGRYRSRRMVSPDGSIRD